MKKIQLTIQRKSETEWFVADNTLYRYGEGTTLSNAICDWAKAVKNYVDKLEDLTTEQVSGVATAHKAIVENIKE